MKFLNLQSRLFHHVNPACYFRVRNLINETAGGREENGRRGLKFAKWKEAEKAALEIESGLREREREGGGGTKIGE